MSNTSNPTTPTNSSSSSSPKGYASSGLEDIQYLLYLETLKRFKEDESNIRRQVEEKTRQHQEIKAEYSQLYAKYVGLVKLAATNAALQQNSVLDDGPVDGAKENIDTIMQQITSGDMTDFLDPTSLRQCKENLRAYKSHDTLKLAQQELATNKAAVKVIQVANESVDNTLEMAIVQGLDHFADELQPENFDKIGQ